MKNKLYLLLACYVLFVLDVKAQTCTTLGQTPSTAFPVCGTKKFVQSNVPICSTTSLYVPGCTGNSNANYQNKNPYFYKFTCYAGGTLNFLVTPNNLNDDYDWQLYDITGKNPDDIFTDKTLVVSGNWAGTYGVTGASATGSPTIVCASDPAQNLNSFALSPVLTEGHTYLLMISHFTDSQSGYTLEFNGGSAVITDPTIPAFKEAKPKCDSKEIIVKLNKKIKCNSIAANGSDFSLSPAIANVISATGLNCSSSFDTDSLLVILDHTIPPGNYALIAQNGVDGNTLLDNCDNPLPVGQPINFTINPLEPTHIDSLAPLACAPDKLVLVFKKNIQCSSIAPDGSDFMITGTYPVTITGASGNCANGSSPTITLQLSKPLYTQGDFTIILKSGLDGNSIIDECGITTPIGEQKTFSVKDTVNADFNFSIEEGCKTDLVHYTHDGAHDVISWKWSFDNGLSLQQNPDVVYTSTGLKTTRLIVSNGFCTDSSQQSFTLNPKLKAAFTGPDVLCPEDAALFTDKSVKAVEWNWNFGNGVTSTSSTPAPQVYPPTSSTKTYTIELIVSDGTCLDTAYQKMMVVKSCYIDVPTAFTPNEDGLNDYLYPLNAYKAENLEFKVYNRYGQLVFETTDWTVKWDGNVKGNPQPAGTYAWYLKYTNRDTGKKIFLKGTTVLIR